MGPRTASKLAIATLALVAGVTTPPAAQADVRFGAELATTASDSGVSAFTPAVAGNEAGVVAMAYPQNVVATNDEIYARIKRAGSARFDAPARLDDVPSSDPDIAVAADGTVTAAWYEKSPCVGSSVWMATAPPGGSFGPKTKVSDNAFKPHVAIAPNGDVAVLYTLCKGAGVKEERLYTRPRTGASSEVVLSDGTYGGVDASDADIAFDGNGTAIAAFTQSLTAAPFTRVLRIARKPAGSGWNAQTLAGPVTNHSALAVARDGHAVVADVTNVNGTHVTQVRSLAPGQGVFGPPQMVSDPTDSDQVESLAIADSGGAAAVTMSHGDFAVRPSGAVPFPQATPGGLSAFAGNVVAAFTGEDELALLDVERFPPESQRFALVARVQRPGTPLGEPQLTGLTSDATGSPVLAPFGANNVVAGWQHRPEGTTTFGAGVALGDGTPPTLGGSSAPAGGTVGTPLSFGVTPSDDLALANVEWQFGDGAGAAGASAMHAFGTPGGSSWSVTARDLAGNTASATGQLSIAARLAVRIAKPRRGTRARRLKRLRGTATGPVARVELAVVRTSRGCRRLRRNGVLAAARPAPRGGCKPGRFLRARGTQRWKFRLRHRLPAGRYAVWARAVSADGAKSRLVRVTFKLRG